MSDATTTTSLKQEVLNELFSFQRFGIKPGLERTLVLLDSVDNPQEKLRFIHVAGTNGKGSISSSIASILNVYGLKVGLYTSPHIFEFNERIRVGLEQISDSEIVSLFNRLINKSKEIGATFFEITTVMAFLHFVDKGVDIAVIETGMGGQFDATNVVTPLLSIITKIDLDHQEYLGNTIEEITKEKAGIIKKTIPIILSENIPAVQSIVKNVALQMNSPFFYSPDLVSLSDITYNTDLKLTCDITFNSSLTKKEKDDVKIENLKNIQGIQGVKYIAGVHQTDNLKTILLALPLLGEVIENITSQIVKEGLAGVQKNFGLRYRLEKQEFLAESQIGERKKLVFFTDVSHNINSINASISTLKLCGLNRLNILFSAMADKDIDGMLSVLLDYILGSNNQKLIITQIDYSRAIKLEELSTKARLLLKNKLIGQHSLTDVTQIIQSKIIEISTPKQAFDYLISQNNTKQEQFICLGSFYLFADLKERLE